LIAALVIVQAGRLPAPMAYAGMSADRGDYTLLTADSGRGRDTNPYEILYVIDSRDQVLLAYEVEDARRQQVTLRDGANLEALFRRARP
jgi:hypothetical protein